MDLYDLLFGAGPMVNVLMKLEYLPKKEDFHELTPQQYQKYYETNEDTHEKMYALLPSNKILKYEDMRENDVITVSAQQMSDMLKAVEIVNNYCKDATYPLPTDEDKLRYAAARLPDVFSKDSKFANAAIMSVNK